MLIVGSFVMINDNRTLGISDEQMMLSFIQEYIQKTAILDFLLLQKARWYISGVKTVIV